MAHVIYLGDELSAAGWRLAGADVRIPRAPEASAALQAALQAPRPETTLVLVSAALLPSLDTAALRLAQAALQPLVIVVPDLAEGLPAPDIAARLRSQLGMEA